VGLVKTNGSAPRPWGRPSNYLYLDENNIRGFTRREYDCLVSWEGKGPEKGRKEKTRGSVSSSEGKIRVFSLLEGK